MAISTEELEAHLMSLGAAERTRLIQKILIADLSPDPTVQGRWADEIQSRVERYNSGDVQPYAGDEVMADMKERVQR